ncbi:DUF6691 family protein [Salinibacter sp. 10B]|uniref:DUF6691 family protein n=1 Tax=Salinibacter sp. 10B TaxID=1923971 RepID=UPI000CF37F4D|nr:DUF6691 family protein [Salinibacter sp. 10B]
MSTQTSTSPSTAQMRLADALIYLGMGTLFGIILIKSEVVSWFRIQEMFRFQAFHMYGIIGSAIVVAGASIALLRRADATTIRGEPITISDKPMNKGTNQILGGIVFGLGWGLLGACPGPIYALIGAGVTPVAVALLGAAAGAWTYGHLKPHLPH